MKSGSDPNAELASCMRPKLATIFFVVGGMILLVVGLLVFSLTGFSAVSARVFVIEAFLAGMAVIAVIKLQFKRNLVVALGIPIPLTISGRSYVCTYSLYVRLNSTACCEAKNQWEAKKKCNRQLNANDNARPSQRI